MDELTTLPKTLGDEEGEPVLKGPTELVEGIKTPDPVERMTEDWL
jgi:hypothetical protein